MLASCLCGVNRVTVDLVAESVNERRVKNDDSSSRY